MIKKIWLKYTEMREPVKASVWYTICNIINKAIALLAMPIFTRILVEEEYGQVTIFQSWYNIFIIFTSLNIFMNSYAKGLIKYKNDTKAFTSSMLGLTSMMTIVYGIIYIINIPFWTKIFELSPILMAAMFVELLFIPAIELWAAEERFNYRYKGYVVFTIARTILGLGLGVLAVINTTYKVEARVFTDVLSKSLFGVVLFVWIIKKGKTLYNKDYWKYALCFNIPLIPHYLSNYVLGQSDRLMIGKMVGNTAAAYYSVAYTISMMMTLVVTAINSSLTPYIYKTISLEGGESEKKIKKVTTLIFILVSSLSIISMIFAPEIILVFAGKNYMDAIQVIPPIAASVFFIFVYSMFANIEYYYEKTVFIAVATCVSACLNIFLNYIFIGKFGYHAAGYTTLICYIILAFAHYIFYRIILRAKMPKVKSLYDIRIVILISLVVLVIMFMMFFLYEKIFFRYGLFSMILMILLFACRKNIKKIIKIEK